MIKKTATIAERWTALRLQLRAARLAGGKTQEAVARALTDDPALGERRSWVSRIERGEGIPSVPTVIGYARAVNLELIAAPWRVAQLAELSPAELTAILRAAHSAANRGFLSIPAATAARDALAKLTGVPR